MTFRSSQSRPRNGPLWTSPLADACEPPSNQAANASPIPVAPRDRKSTRLNSSHANISYAVFCLKKKNQTYNSYMSILSFACFVVIIQPSLEYIMLKLRGPHCTQRDMGDGYVCYRRVPCVAYLRV